VGVSPEALGAKFLRTAERMSEVLETSPEKSLGIGGLTEK
jgi:hypothetical protein